MRRAMLRTARLERSANSAVTSASSATSSTISTSSPASTTESPAGTKPPPSRRIEITSEPSGRPRSLHRLARRAEFCGDLQLDDLEPLLGQVEQVHEAVLRHLVLDQAQDQVGRRDRRLDAQQLEVLEVARVVAARDDPRDAVLLARDLADQDVVLVVAGDGDHEVGALDPGALQHPQLGAVAVLDAVLELLLDDRVAVLVGLDDRHLVPLLDQLPREVPADLAGADDQDVHRLARDPFEADLAAHGRLQQLDRGLGRTDGLQALLGVPAWRGAGRARGRRPSRPRSAAWRSGRSRGSCCRRRWRRRTRRPPRCPASISASISSAVPTVNRPPRSSQLWSCALVEQSDRLRVLVEDRDLVALGEHRLGDGRPHPAASDDQDEHAAPTLQSGRRTGCTPSLCHAAAPAGAVRITAQGAFSTT